MIHADAVRCNGIADKFPIDTTISGLGYPKVIIRTDGKIHLWRVSWCQGDAKTKAQRTRADQQDTQRVASELRKRKKVRTLVCYAREWHSVTVGRSPVSLPWFVRCAAQTISRSHRGTDGMASYRRAHGRSRDPCRYVPWSEKVFYLEAVQEKDPG